MKIVIAPVTYRYLEKLTAWGIGQLLACPEPKFVQIDTSPDASIERARSQVATDFLKTEGYDALLFIDDDVVFKPSEAVKLAKHIADGKHIVGGAYVTKSDPPQLAARLYDGQRVEFNDAAKPVEIMYLPGGFTMISREAIEKVSKKLPLTFANSQFEKAFYPFFETMKVNRRIGVMRKNIEWLSEDYAFCERARDCGYKIWLDPSIRLGHVGKYVYMLEDMQRFKTKRIPDENIAVTKVVVA